MKIENRNDLGAVSSPGAKGAAGVDGGNRRDAGRAVENTGPDRAELSGLAGKISEALSDDAAKRAANVEQIRTQVVGGVYQTDAVATSRGIVDDALTSAAAAGGNSTR